ncbi:MAG TPA: GNAT family N-acetyltransferase [Pirellulales bacterium]|nr:GNAT family N-acetyltransferase [Pirellulales bacterium]
MPTRPTLEIRRTSPPDHAGALELLFAHLGDEDRQRRREEAAKNLGTRAGDTLWGAYRRGQLLSAALTSTRAGGIADMWLPKVSALQPANLVQPLAASVVKELAQLGIRSAQVLLDRDHGVDADLLREVGFEHLANLVYQVSLPGSFPTDQPNDGLEFVAYSPDEHARFAELVQRTYVGSLDCSPGGGEFTAEDALAGYCDLEGSDSPRWWIATQSGQDLGCLLLARHFPERSFELTYMGVVPEGRGCGLGLAIVRQAQWLAAMEGASRLTLAVDADNAPAIRVYGAAGFVVWDERAIFVRHM